jgi:hypothetical protein
LIKKEKPKRSEEINFIGDAHASASAINAVSQGCATPNSAKLLRETVWSVAVEYFVVFK